MNNEQIPQLLESRTQELIFDVPMKGIELLSSTVSNEELNNRLFGIDHKNRYAFNNYALIGSKKTGYCMEVYQEYSKSEQEVNNLISFKILYGIRSKHQQSGDLIDVSFTFDISDDLPALVEASKLYVASNGKRTNKKIEDPLTICQELQKIKDIYLENGDILDENLSEIIFNTRNNGYHEYDYNKILLDYEGKGGLFSFLGKIANFRR